MVALSSLLFTRESLWLALFREWLVLECGSHNEHVNALVAQALLQACDEGQALALYLGLGARQLHQKINVAALARIVGA